MKIFEDYNVDEIVLKARREEPDSTCAMNMCELNATVKLSYATL